jgi:drug/metabolite transporter (DMT)-like permease
MIAVAGDHFSAAVVAFIRIALGAIVVAVAPGAWHPVARADWPRLVAVAVVWMTLPFVLFPWAERTVASSVAGMINAALPVFAALMAAALLRRSPRLVQIAGLVVGFVGVGLIAVPSITHSTAGALGVGALVLAVGCYAIGITITVPLQQRYGTLAPLLRIEIVAGLVMLPFALAGLRNSTFAWSALIANGLLGVLATGAAFLALLTLMGRVGSTRSSTVTYLFPVVALILGVTFRGEPLHAVAIVGTALVLAGAWLVSRRERDDER